jgi:hypothetical protein
MKVNILDAHDRLQQFKKQSDNISNYCQSLIDQRPFGEHPFYIFSHARTFGLDEKIKMFKEDLFNSQFDFSYKRKYKHIEEVPEKKIIWQPRLTRPKSQSNSMLFKVYPGSDMLKIIWMIPDNVMWDNFTKGKLIENDLIAWSINEFTNHRERLDQPEKDDYTEDKINMIYKELSILANEKKMMERLYDIK